MNFKTILLFVMGVAVMLLSSCSGNEAPDEPKQLKLSQSSLEYPSSGGQSSIEVKSNTQWSVSDVPEWLRLSSKSGNGDASLTITASPNTDYSSRSADIKFVGVNGTAQLTTTLHIHQSLTEAIIVEGSSTSIGWTGGTLEIPYKFTSAPKISIVGSPDWISINNGSRALTEDKVSIVVNENNGEERRATIEFKLEDKTEEYVVTQEAYYPVQLISFYEPTTILLTTNDTYKINYYLQPIHCSDQTLKWSSSNPEVVTVSEDGILMPVSNGESSIKATAERDGVSAELIVKVKIKAQSISFVEWHDGNGWIPGGWNEIQSIQGSWGYEYTPHFIVSPENAYLGDMKMISSNNMLVSVDGDRLICTSDRRSGTAEITVTLPYSDVSSKVTMEVKGYYLLAGLGLMEQGNGFFNIRFSGFVYTNNPTDEFTIEGLSIVDENNQVVTYGCSQIGSGSNKVKWNSNEVNLADYGISIIDNEFYERLSKWKAIVTFSNPKYPGNESQSINIDVHTQY